MFTEKQPEIAGGCSSGPFIGLYLFKMIFKFLLISTLQKKSPDITGSIRPHKLDKRPWIAWKSLLKEADFL